VDGSPWTLDGKEGEGIGTHAVSVALAVEEDLCVLLHNDSPEI
jgi:hypothetical protein